MSTLSELALPSTVDLTRLFSDLQTKSLTETQLQLLLALGITVAALIIICFSMAIVTTTDHHSSHPDSPITSRRPSPEPSTEKPLNDHRRRPRVVTQGGKRMPDHIPGSSYDNLN